MSRRIAFFTIGESPRSDVVPEMARCLGEHVHIDEFGVLDGLDEAQRAELAPRAGSHRFATRLRSGAQIELDHHKTEARLAALMQQADDKGYDVLVPLCTGTLIPRMRSLVVEPQQVVDHHVAALSAHCTTLGLIVPLAAQVETFHLAQPVACAVQTVHASPYESDPVAAAAAFDAAGRALAGCDLIVMHCMGYSQAMRERVARASGRPTLLSNRIVADALGQLLA
ncbi:AroM family protein [Comamonas endophytica]|uniref:AroM family protein n=1 Tax=Comamonas endophytica TaxID=2949090 RepID=A0ABY6G779_9BURK|nr:MULTISPECIES: AroM family protein [unclassified Acidovorax]MCD2511509.1 AroM family protein [Acidovorax sp. D4N7]UYG50896.1 AroM family protein [Acidovorax sp. 5MLIR]